MNNHKKLTSHDLQILYQQNDATLAKWWCELNIWRWPSVLPRPEPTQWIPIPGGRRTEIMKWIVNKIGLKECLRKWNEITLPGKQFDIWYDAHFNNTLTQKKLF